MRTAPVIILNWNGWEDTQECLRYLRDDSQVREAWLVDNGSQIDYTAACTRIFPGLRVLRLEHNYGWAGGYNRALHCAGREGYRMAFLLNNDTRVHPNFLEIACDTLAGDSQLAAVGSLIADGSGLWVRFDGAYHRHGKNALKTPTTSESQSVQTVNGAGMLVNLAAFQKSGGFDERFFCYCEETDWCWRLNDSGWRFALQPSSVVRHLGRRSNHHENACYYYHRNQFLLFAKHGTRSRWASREQLATALSSKVKNLEQTGDEKTYLALKQALQDGLDSRFGVRPEPVPMAG